MYKLLALCAASVILAAITESKSISQLEEPCYECAEEAYQRIKRDAPAILNSVSNLVNGILDTNWKYITRLRAQKLAAQRRSNTVVIGPGNNNNNRVMFNGGNWDVRRRNDY